MRLADRHPPSISHRKGFALPRMFASDRHCVSASTDRARYDNDKSGFIHVEDPRDVQALKAAGYVVAGHTPRARFFYKCACGFEAFFRHCPRCDRTDLEKVAA